MKTLIILPFLLFSLLFVPASSAEIFNCSGKWTNKPCEGEAISSFEERSDPRLAHPDYHKKKFIMRELIELENRYAFYRQYGIVIPGSMAADNCFQVETSLEQCQQSKLRVYAILAQHKDEIKRIDERNELLAQLEDTEQAANNAEIAAIRSQIAAEEAAVKADWAATQAARTEKAARNAAAVATANGFPY